MKTTVALVLISVALCACHAPDARILTPTTRLSPGQTKAEVLAVMGGPLTTMSPGGGVELLTFQFRQPRGLLKTTVLTDYLVRLVDGKLEAYGTPRDLKPAAPIVVLGNEKTVNVNIKTSGDTNAIAPIQPRLNIPTN